MLINVMLIKKNMYIKQFWPRLHATAVSCAHELINGEAGKILAE